MALQPPAASLGTLGNYDLLEKVGEGSMGTVFRAMHWTTKDIVAIKVMPSHVARKPLLLKRFELEFRIANRVHHPNVVRVLEYSGQGPEPFLVMEFVEGASLGERLEAQGRLSEEEALRRPSRSARGCSAPTTWACCTATSSRTTSWSRARGTPSWPTWGWARRWTRTAS
jgi:hypothetical protein